MREPGQAGSASAWGSRWRLIAWALSGWALFALPAGAQECPVNWERSVACTVEVQIDRPGERPQTLRRDELTIEAGSNVDLLISARDQWGRVFPPQRMVWGLETGRGCRDRITVEELEEGRFRLLSGAQRGRCDLMLWVPGNLNLDRILQIEVVARFREGYGRREAELVAARLFRAILGRDGDPEGLRHAVSEVQRGRLESQVRGMCTSAEYRSQRQRLPAHQLLDDLYQGILGRPADSSGVRNYLADVEQGRCAEVVLSLVRSEEHEATLTGR